jgi:hypothetical protein
MPIGLMTLLGPYLPSSRLSLPHLLIPPIFPSYHPLRPLHQAQTYKRLCPAEAHVPNLLLCAQHRLPPLSLSSSPC